MSGIELVGLAASVLQIADLGWKSSYKLYAFSKKVHDAGKSIELVSQDIAATGAILKQLGEELKKDEENTPAGRLGTQGLIVAASKLVDECQTLFREIDQGITGEEGSKVILGFKQKLKWSYLEPRVDLLRTNLERLKSSLALMLNVLIYAEQHRTRQAASVLKEQQELVASFAQQTNDSERRIEDLKRRIEPAAPPTKPITPESLTQPASHVANPSTGSIAVLRSQNPEFATKVAPIGTMVSANVSAVQISLPASNVSALPAKIPRKALPADTPLATSKRPRPKQAPESIDPHLHLDQHTRLFHAILEEVNSSKYALDHGFRYRLHDGVLELHWREWEPLRATHGDQKLLAILARSPLLECHWYERVMKPTSQGWEQMSHSIRVSPQVPEENAGSLISVSSTGTQKPRQTLDSYVASFRKRQATAWHDRPQVLAPHVRDKSRAAQESIQPDLLRVSDDSAAAVPAGSPVLVPKIRHGGVVVEQLHSRSSGQQGFLPISSQANPGVPIRLSADDTHSSEPDTNYHKRPSAALQEARSQAETVPVSRKKVNPEIYCPQEEASSLDEDCFGVLKELTAIEQTKKAEDLRRRGSVGERTMAMGSGRLFVANPDVVGVEHVAQQQQSDAPDSNYSSSNDAQSIKPIIERGDESRGPGVGKVEAYRNRNAHLSNSQTSTSNHAKAINDTLAPTKQIDLAERAKYQFGADSEDEDIQDSIETNLDILSSAAERLNTLAIATGEEVEAKPLAQKISKRDRLGGDIPFSDPAASIADRYLTEWTTVKPTISLSNTERLHRIR